MNVVKAQVEEIIFVELILTKQATCNIIITHEIIIKMNGELKHEQST